LTEGRIVKVNVDHSPKLATRYNVQSIPTLLVFMDGQIVDRAMGFHNERDLRRLLQQ
jgi:thioredoxin